MVRVSLFHFFTSSLFYLRLSIILANVEEVSNETSSCNSGFGSDGVLGGAGATGTVRNGRHKQ